MAQSLSKIHIRINAFALPGRTTQHIHTIPRVSLRLPWAMRSLGFQPARFAPLTVSSACPLCLPWAMRSLGFQPARFAPLTVSSACPLRLPWAMRSLGFAMHYWLHLSNSSMLDCIRFERSFSPFETKSETLVKTIRNRRRRSAPPTPLKCCFESKKCKITCMNSKDIISL